MGQRAPKGYAGRFLRVDLGTGSLADESLAPEEMRRWIGGAGMGAKYLYDEVAPGTGPFDAENRLILTTGPFTGTRLSGSGLFNATAKGPMTDGAGISQANGNFGTFLRSNGYDGVVIAGIADSWQYLVVSDGKPELRDATHLVGRDTLETEDAIRAEWGAGARQMSVFGIGPSGEKRVRFAAIVGDRGHVAAHNGLGAVMGSKRLKAFAAVRGPSRVAVHDEPRLAELAGPIVDAAVEMSSGVIKEWGTAGNFSRNVISGQAPVRNYTTCVFPEHESISGQYLLTHFEHKPNPCVGCRLSCRRSLTVTEGPHAGYAGEEPEYEGLAGLGSQLGITDAGTVVMLCNECDRTGMDINETGWVLGFAIECHEKGLITSGDLGGLDLSWNNGEAVRTLLWRIARREGIGDLLAEGVRRAAQTLGGEALNIGIYTTRGSTPRGHDHRNRWSEMLDTCTSDTGTIEATWGPVKPERWGLPPLVDRFSPEEVSTLNAAINGWHQLEDSLGVCRFCTGRPEQIIDAVKAVTGWDYSLEEGMGTGRRIVNLLRAFNIRHGITPGPERPSPRYGSTPPDGPAMGISSAGHWDYMVRNFREKMGWEPETGKPLPETLRALGLDFVVPHVWG